MWDFDGSLPVYKQITDELRRRIVSGTWAPGYRLPLETELSEEFGVARMTMNKALSILQQQGLIIRRKRLGTIVNHPQARIAEVRINTIRRTAMELGQSYELRILLKVERTSLPKERELYRLGENVLEIRALHLIDGRPVSLEERLICLTRLPEARNIDLSAHTPEEFLLSVLPWATTETRIAPVVIDITLGRDLEVRPGTAGLQLERRVEFERDCYAFGRLTSVGPASVLLAKQVALH